MGRASPTQSGGRAGWMAASVVVMAGCLVGGVVAVGVTAPAGATQPLVDVADSTVACTHVSGVETFDPRLRTPGTTHGLETVHLDLALSGCSSPALRPPITIVGQLKGELVADTGTSCSTSLGLSPYTSLGTLTVKWKTHKAKIPPVSTFAPQRIKPAKTGRKAATEQSVKGGGAGSPRPSVVGDFTGGNSGRTSSFTLSWRRTSATCSAGMHVLPIVSGALAFS